MPGNLSPIFQTSTALIYLPLFLSSAIFGLAPMVSAPVLIFVLTLAMTMQLAAKTNFSRNAVLPLIAGIVLILIAQQCDSYNLEKSLTIAAAMLYGWTLLASSDQHRTILKFALISGNWFVCFISLGTIFWTRTHPNSIAMINPNALSLQTAIILPLTIEQFLFHRNNKQTRQQCFILAILAVQCVTLLYAKSLGAFAALLIAGVITSRYQTKKIWITIVCVIMGAALYKWTLNAKALIDRWYWAQTAFYIFKDHWLFGSLTDGGFFRLYPIYKGSQHASQSTTLVHNLYLELMADFGIPGLVLIALLLFTLFRTIRTSQSRAIKTSLLVLLITGFFDSSHLFLPNLLACVGVLVLATQFPHPLSLRAQRSNLMKESSMRLPRVLASPGTGLPAGLPRPHRRWGLAMTEWESFAVALGFLILVTWIGAQSARLTIARAYMLRSEFYLSGISAKPQRLPETRALILKSLYWDKENPYSWVDLMKIELLYSFADSSHRPIALVAAQEALRLDPYNKIYLSNVQLLTHRQK